MDRLKLAIQQLGDRIWEVILAVAVVWEGVGIATPYPTLTEWTVRHVPQQYTLAFFVWGFLHFRAKYLEARRTSA